MFINAVIPDQHFLVAGESYGGYLTLGLIGAMKDKIDGILLICPQTCDDMPVPHRCLLYQEEGFGTDDTDWNGFLNIAVMATSENYEKYKRDVLPGIALANQGFYQNSILLLPMKNA